MKDRIVVRMGAGKFTAAVRHHDNILLFDINTMTKKQEHEFRRELVAQFRIAGEAAA